jgi:hypothetical protein
MGRQPSCKICGTKLNVKTAYMHITYSPKGNAKKAFYCSQDEYEKYLAEETLKKNKENDDKNAVTNLINEIFEYNVKNTALLKEWSKWKELANNEKIAAYLKENKEYLNDVMTKKDFSSEYGKIRYFSTILCNGLKDFTEKIKEKSDTFVPVIEDEHYETKFKLRVRKALLDFEEEYDE